MLGIQAPVADGLKFRKNDTLDDSKNNASAKRFAEALTFCQSVGKSEGWYPRVRRHVTSLNAAAA